MIGGSILKIFTYYDYIKSIHCVKRNFINGLAEESEKYNLISEKHNKEEYNLQYKLIKEILEDKKEIVNLVNKFLKPNNKIAEQNIEKYTYNYMSKKYKSKKASILYRTKDKDIYFLVEHQSKIDYNLPYKILNYCIDIVQEWKKERKNKVSKYPIIVPIVVYTGKDRFNIPRNYENQQIRLTLCEENRMKFSYNLIDINSYSINELLKNRTIFSYILIMGKSKNKEEFIRNIKLIIEKESKKEILNKIWNIIKQFYGEFLKENEQKELLKIINNKIDKEK